MCRSIDIGKGPRYSVRCGHSTSVVSSRSVKIYTNSGLKQMNESVLQVGEKSWSFQVIHRVIVHDRAAKTHKSTENGVLDVKHTSKVHRASYPGLGSTVHHSEAPKTDIVQAAEVVCSRPGSQTMMAVDILQSIIIQPSSSLKSTPKSAVPFARSMCIMNGSTICLASCNM